MLSFIYFEFKALVAGPFTAILAFLLLSMALFAAYNGHQRVAKQRATLREVNQKAEDFYAKNRLLLDSIEKGLRKPVETWYKDPTNPLPMSAFRGAGRYATLPPAPLAVISTGQSDIFPYYTKVALGDENAADDNQSFENPFNTATGQFDLAFVLTFILPLFIVALGYNVLSAEREQGTLLLLLSMPINIKYWMLHKMWFRYGVLFLSTVAIVSFSLAVFGVTLAQPAFAWLLLSIGLYTLFWFGLCFGINLLGRSSANNALMLLGAWLFFTLLVPSLANLTATALYPVPSRVQYVNALRAAQNKAEQEKEGILVAFYSKNPRFVRKKQEADKTWRDWWRENLAEGDYLAQLTTQTKLKFDTQAQVQRGFANRFRYLSPTIMMQNALNQLAGTDTQTYLQFHQRTAEFEQRWSAYFKAKFLNDEKLTTKDFERFPTY